MTTPPGAARELLVEFCGEETAAEPGRDFVIGRGGDLDIDDNPWLHRRFLVLRWDGRLWWLHNEGDLLAATLSDPDGLVQTWMAPGAAVPLVLPRARVVFTAGPTTYDVDLVLTDPPYRPAPDADEPDGAVAGAGPGAEPLGGLTLGPPRLTDSQRALIVALAEPVLLGRAGVGTEVPSNAAAAERLGWAQTRFNRKLDNVCDRLSTAGVTGLRGGPAKLASQRRVRLVEYAVAARLVTPDDLALLPEEGRAPTG